MIWTHDLLFHHQERAILLSVLLACIYRYRSNLLHQPHCICVYPVFRHLTIHNIWNACGSERDFLVGRRYALKLPLWVPVTVRRYATLSPSARISSTLKWRSENALESPMMNCLCEFQSIGGAPGKWKTCFGEKSFSTFSISCWL